MPLSAARRLLAVLGAVAVSVALTGAASAQQTSDGQVFPGRPGLAARAPDGLAPGLRTAASVGQSDPHPRGVRAIPHAAGAVAVGRASERGRVGSS